MSTAVEMADARASSAHVTESDLVVFLEDGRTLSVPISWYPRLAAGTPEERDEFKISGSGAGMHWPQLDEDISVESMLAGLKPGESAASLKRWKAQLEARRRNPQADSWGEAKPLPDWWDGA